MNSLSPEARMPTRFFFPLPNPLQALRFVSSPPATIPFLSSRFFEPFVTASCHVFPLGFSPSNVLSLAASAGYFSAPVDALAGRISCRCLFDASCLPLTTFFFVNAILPAPSGAVFVL